MAIATANPVVSAAAGKSYFARDDYYVKNMESRDRWHGKLATKLGLNGQVTQAEFTALLDKVEERGVSTGKKVTPALDITISANKSLSLAMTYPEHEKKLQDIYLRSMEQTCDEIEKIIETRQGYRSGIQQHHKTGNACFAILNHELNRYDEPHKHCHIIMYNITENRDGKLGAIYNLDVMKQQKEFGRIANRILSKNLQDEGYELEITDQKKGQWEMKGCSRDTILGQSKRRRAIEKYAKENGLNLQDAKQMQTACLATRPEKNHHADLAQIKMDTQEYLRGQGYSVSKQQGPITHTKEEKKEIFQQVLKDMEIEDFSFSQEQLIERIMNAGVLAGITKNGAERMLKRDKSLESFQNMRTERKEFAFKSNIKLSEKNLKLLVEGKGKGCHMESLKAERLLSKVCEDQGVLLTAEQRLLVLNALTCKDTICGANGEAGTGKTFSLKILHECCQRAGIEIKGMAPSGRAADGLQDDSGIQSTTLDRYILEAEKESKRNMGQLYEIVEDLQHKRTAHIDGLERSKVPRILVVDESGMTDEIKLGMVLDIATKRGDKIVLAGDVKQLQAIGVGHTMETFIRHGMSTSYMIDIQRQKEDELLSAVKNSVEGDMDVTFAILDRKAVENSVKKYLESDRTGIVQADTVQAADRETKMIRKRLKVEGKLKNEKILTVEGLKQGDRVEKTFSEGDRVVLGRRNKKLGIDYAGILGTITHIDDFGKVQVRQDNGQETSFYTDKYGAVDYAYALPTNDRWLKNIDVTKLITATSGLREVQDYGARMEQVKQQYLDIEGNRKCAAVCVGTNNKREAYNAAIRSERIQRGELAEGSTYILDDGQIETREKQVNLSQGDRIVFLKNTDKLQVKNGTMAELMGIDKEGNARAVTDAGKEVEWNLHEFKSLDHAYAITVHKAQGMTVDHVIADQTTNEVNDRNKFYVVVSRARYNATVYTNDKDKYRKQVRRWAEKSSYDDYERSKNTPHIENGSYQNKEERALADEAQTKLPGAELERRRMLPLELTDDLLADIREHAVKHNTVIQPAVSKQLQESVRTINKSVAEKELQEGEKPVAAMQHVKRSQRAISKNEHIAGHGLGR